jgi:prolycopene isomerase
MNEMRELKVGTDLLLCSCFDVIDPGFSPEGTCQLNVVTLKYGEPWMRVPPSEYAEAKFRSAEVMLNRLEEAFPGLRSHIEEIEVASPLTYMRYLGHPKGAIYGFDRYTKDIPFTRAASFRPDSDIQGLYFAGGWMGDHGFPSTYLAGLTTAEAVLNDKQA